MAVQIQSRRDTAANWTSNNPTLASGEIGIETDTLKIKVGDGSTAWTSLNYIALKNVIEDTTPELGGEMDAGAHTIGFTQQSATGDGTDTIDWKLGNKFFFTMGAFNETFTFTAPTNPCSLILVVKQDSVGSRIPTWPAAVKWPGGTAPTLTTAANSIDIIAFYSNVLSYL